MYAFLLLLQLTRVPATAVQVTDAGTAVPATVTINEFLIAQTETTQAEFEEVMGFNPSHHRGPKRPVENVTWWDAIRYCNLRSMRENLEPAYDLATGECDSSKNGYRLPADAEWEAALGKPDAEGAQLGSANTKDAGLLVRETVARGTRDVGSGKPNALGLHDMIGNVWEWCQDWFNPSSSAVPAAIGVNRVIRGGSFITTRSRWARAYRSSIEPREHSRFTGFRVARSAGRPAPVTFPANWYEPYHRVPPAFVNQTGGLSPLAEGVTDAKQWPARREQLRKRWLEILGRPPVTPPSPEVRLIRESQQPTYTGRLMQLRTEPDSWEKIYVMLPARPVRKPMPVVIVPYYDVDTPAGENLGGRSFGPPSVRSFALMAVQNGWTAVAIRWFGESYGESYDEAVANLHIRYPGVTGLGKWVWDAQRLLDYLYTRPEVDRNNIGIIGHSLGGKMALYAAALEPRITAVVSSELGIGLSFSNYEDFWYLGERTRTLPPGADHHELLALVAPRPFLLIGGESSDKDASWHYINAVRPVYRLLNRPDDIGHFNHRSGHSPTVEAMQLSMEWFRRFLRQQ
jgi:hypothetical protein